MPRWHGRHVVLNHRQLDCLFNSLYNSAKKKSSKLHIIGLLWGEPSMTSGFLSQMASNATSVSMTTQSWPAVGKFLSVHLSAYQLTTNQLHQSIFHSFVPFYVQTLHFKYGLHRSGNIILINFRHKLYILIISGAASDVNFIKMTTFPFPSGKYAYD